MPKLNQIKPKFFSCCKMLGLFRLSRWLMRNRLLILGYHGFAYNDEASFRPILFMCPETFRNRMSLIKRHGFKVIPLDDAVRHLSAGTLPNNAVVITIDDGFYSVLDLAAPVLQQYGFPSTLYVTSYYSEKNTPIFRLAVQYIFWRSTKSELVAGDEDWLPKITVSLNESGAREKAIWRIINFGETQCDENKRQAIVRKLANLLEVDYTSIYNSRSLALLSKDELKCLEKYDIDIQLHTHRHNFPADNLAIAKKEIEDNRNSLRGVSVSPLIHFCYPSGEWDSKVFGVLADLNIASATTCQAGLNTAKTFPLALYRILDQDDISDVEFEAELFGFAELLRMVRGIKRRTDRLHQRATG